MSLPFRFDAGPHHYVLEDTGEVAQSITGMLKVAKNPDTGRPWVETAFFDVQGSQRGDWVHQQTAAYDLGLLERPELVEHEHKGYLLAHVACMRTLAISHGLKVLKVEEPGVHSVFRFAGRIDRVVEIRKVRGIWEIKTGDPEKAHQIQTALEAILESDLCGIPPAHLERRCCYLRANGRFKVVHHDDRRDIAKAYEVLRQCGLQA